MDLNFCLNVIFEKTKLLNVVAILILLNVFVIYYRYPYIFNFFFYFGPYSFVTSFFYIDTVHFNTFHFSS